MRMLDHRLQILLDEGRYRKVSREADRRRVSVATVIRDAIDHLPAAADVRKSAIDAILAAEQMPLPVDPADLRRELDAAHDHLNAQGRTPH
jgi:hypothetical protein